MGQTKIKSHNLAFAYAGCYIGAGFLSGQELWQFFGSFGKNGLLGLILALIIQGTIGCVVLFSARKKGDGDFSKIITIFYCRCSYDNGGWRRLAF